MQCYDKEYKILKKEAIKNNDMREDDDLDDIINHDVPDEEYTLFSEPNNFNAKPQIP